MSEAALEEDNTPALDPVPEQELEQVESEAPEESAPQAEVEPKEPESVQIKINKVVGRMHAEKRKAEALQRQIDDMKAAAPQQPEVKAPTLEDFDYDEAAFNAASISHLVTKGVAAESQRLQKQGLADQQVQAQQAVAQAFDAQVAACTAKNADYQDKVAQLPQFNADILSAIMESEQGADLAYELANRLDLADEIANASPYMAAMKLGALSEQLKATPNIKPSAAPAPIDPINSGGSIASERGPRNATFE